MNQTAVRCTKKAATFSILKIEDIVTTTLLKALTIYATHSTWSEVTKLYCSNWPSRAPKRKRLSEVLAPELVNGPIFVQLQGFLCFVIYIKTIF